MLINFSGFMTSTMQTYARKTQIPIDTLTFRTEVRQFHKDDIRDVPEHGELIYYCYLLEI